MYAISHDLPEGIQCLIVTCTVPTVSKPRLGHAAAAARAGAAANVPCHFLGDLPRDLDQAAGGSHAAETIFNNEL